MDLEKAKLPLWTTSLCAPVATLQTLIVSSEQLETNVVESIYWSYSRGRTVIFDLVILWNGQFRM
jgi:hypothetical protein